MALALLASRVGLDEKQRASRQADGRVVLAPKADWQAG